MGGRGLRMALVIVTALSFVMLGGNGNNGNNGQGKKEEFAPDRILVKFKEGISAEQIQLVHAHKMALKTKKLVNEHKKQRARNRDRDEDLKRVHVVTMPPGENVHKWVKLYADDPSVEYAQPDYVCTTQMTPNDPYFGSSGSWGQLYRDMWGLEKIQAEQAWDINSGNSGVVVAVIDTGVDYNHPDIAANIWRNPGEIPGNGIDDDNNGFIDDVNGWDFANNDNNPMDGHGHGTHVSGTIAAIGNNGVGVIGIAWNCRIMPVKGLSDSGSGYDSDLARALIYAADNGARLCNNSWGGSGSSQVITDAVKYANSHGCVVVVAAGNSNADAANYHPAGIPEAVTVASSDTADVKSDFSNYGSVVDVSAPGGNSFLSSSTKEYDNILSLRANGTDMYRDGIHIVGTQYYRSRGTSMACPHAAGVLSLIASQNPGRSNDWIVAQLKGSTDNIDALNPGYQGLLGTGRVNAYRALTGSSRPDLIYAGYSINDSAGNGNGCADRGETVQLTVTLQSLWGEATNVQGTLTTTDPYVSISTAMAGFGTIPADQSGSNAASPFVFTVLSNVPIDHTATFSLNIVADGGYSTSATFTVNVGPKLDYSSMAISDPTGNNNAVADPGETVDFIITLANSWGAASNVTGTLSTTDTGITMLSTNGSFGNIAANQTGSNTATPFRFSVIPMKAPGSQIAFTLSVLANGGYAKTISIQLGITANPWSTNTTVNNVVSNATKGQLYPCIAGDGKGGGFIAWEDNRNGTYWDIYARKVTTGGVVPMPEFPICIADKDQYSPQIVGDGVGGAIIAWEDFRSGNSYDIYAQRVNANGVVQWAVGGVAVCTSNGDQYQPQLIGDGAGGAIIVWMDKRGSSGFDIYAQRINSSGVTQWTANGVPVCTATDDQTFQQLIGDGAGGAIIVWQDGRNSATDARQDIYAQRINSAGVAQWAQNGVAICSSILDQYAPKLVGDGSGGAILVWQDDRGSGYTTYSQRINSSGVAQWIADGVLISSTSGTDPTLVGDGAGGAIYTWHDNASIAGGVFAQRLNGNGAALWGTNGVTMTVGSGSPTGSPLIVSDGQGGAWISWFYDYLLMNCDFYIRRINANGVFQWGTGSNVSNAQNLLVNIGMGMISDEQGGAIVTWHDYRGTDYNNLDNPDVFDVYAQRVYAKLLNISTRAYVGTGTNVLNGGFIIGGTEPKTVIIRAKGPSLVDFGLTGVLTNPYLKLYSFSARAYVAQNDNWQTNDPLQLSPIVWKGTAADIQASGLQPTGTNSAYEAALLVTLPPGNYSGIVSGVSNGVGIGMIEVFEVNGPVTSSKLTNISARAYVGTGTNATNGGFIIGGVTPKKVIIRAKGPSLVDFGLTGVLANPYLKLYSFSAKAYVAQNDNWQTDDPLQLSPIVWKGTAADIQATGLQPTGTNSAYEAALLVTLPPGSYSGIVSGVSNGVGTGMIEVFEVNK